MYNQLELIELLKKENYGITVHQHDALFTVQDSKELRGKINGAHSKNLFLKNKKNKFFLLTCEETDKIDLKKISKSLNLGNTSFAKEKYLDQYLKIKPGSVSPFALLNDEGQEVSFYLEQTLFEVTLNFNTEEGASGDFPIGYITTVNTWGMIDWLNTEDNIDNPNMTDTSMNHMITMAESSVNIEKEISLPGSFKLEQNYPNPFNPSTKIEFSLSTASEVSLEIFDINGNSVDNLVNNYMNAGTHHIFYDGSNVSSGIYYYTLKASNKIQTRKMTLIK